jgi:ATP-dependent exoDNAse (exonuclease V) alpha subunit
LEKLRNLAQPVASIEAAHNCPQAKQASSNTACGLERFCSLSTDSKVMLRSNLWVEKGLVNGSIGHVLNILYLEQGPPDLPSVVICDFPDYQGPPFLPDHPHSFPVVPIQRVWSEQNKTMSRTALPLSLAWALTVHKSQGLTLPKAVVDIGRHEMSAGISFVALSRVQHLPDLVVMPFPLNRITSLGGHKQIKERKAEEERLRTLQL